MGTLEARVWVGGIGGAAPCLAGQPAGKQAEREAEEEMGVETRET